MLNTKEVVLYRFLVLAAMTVIGIGTVFYHLVEGWNWLDSYYFCVVTLATVGYGDYVPHTNIGKLFTTFYILVGVAIFTTFISVTLHRRARMAAERHGKIKQK